MKNHRELLPEETAALQAFADAYGRNWRDELGNVYWYNARIWNGPVPGMGNVLHAIRNEFGPTWLWNVCRIKPANKYEKAARAAGWYVNVNGNFETNIGTDIPDEITTFSPSDPDGWATLCHSEGIKA